MKIADKHIGQAALLGMLLSWAVLLGVIALFEFISELDRVRADYSALDVLVYVAYTVPGDAYNMFPTAALLGAILGVGTLSANSELVAYRAAGVSRLRISMAAMGSAAVLLLMVLLVAEFVMPTAESRARQHQIFARSGEVGLSRETGMWLRDGERVINARRPVFAGNDLNADVVELADVNIFEYSDGELRFTAHADVAVRQSEGWLLKGVYKTSFDDLSVKTEHFTTLNWPSLISAELVKAAVTEPRYLSLRELWPYQEYLSENGLDDRVYRAAVWERLAYPLTVFALVLAGMPFVFGSIRGGGIGQRIFVGMVLGVGFFILNRAIARVGLVYEVSPIVTAVLPTLVVLLIAVWVLRKGV